MKKVLFATTALIATASVAAADVRISGYGRFGLDYNEANDNRRIDTDGDGVVDTVLDSTSITSRLRLQFDMSAETDGGVTFGARFRAQAESRDNQVGKAFATPGAAGVRTEGATFNGARFFASFGGLTVGVGNILGAVDAMQGLYLETRAAGAGIDGMGFTSLVANMAGNSFDWDAYSSAGTGVNGLEVIYNAGAFGVHVSYSKQNDTTTGPAPAAISDGEENTAISAYYTFGDWTIAAGFNDEEGVGVGNDNDLAIVTVQGDLGFAGVRFAYAQMDNTGATGGDSEKLGLYGTFDIGAATSLVAFVTDEDSPGLASDGTGYGLHLSHDLGGGVSIEAAWVESSNDNTQVQAGMYFSF
jgi:outer membrane protein OmpU